MKKWMVVRVKLSEIIDLAGEVKFPSCVIEHVGACRIISCTMRAQQETITRPDKTGTLSSTQGLPGRKGPNPWSLSMSLAASGAAGTVPDSWSTRSDLVNLIRLIWEKADEWRVGGAVRRARDLLLSAGRYRD